MNSRLVIPTISAPCPEEINPWSNSLAARVILSSRSLNPRLSGTSIRYTHHLAIFGKNSYLKSLKLRPILRAVIRSEKLALVFF